MNFPETEKTGALAEDRVAQLFLSWDWNYGRDRIDIGYDLFVTPNQSKYFGGRFLVQVKGTAKKKNGTVVAQAQKSRLRQYAEATLPVFLVRVMPEGDMYWIHVQNWALKNPQKLKGNGSAGVRFDSSRRLDEREQFEAYLQEILKPLPEDLRVLKDLAEESTVLSAIDPNLGVRVRRRDGVTEHQIFAKTDGVTSTFAFTLGREPNELHKLTDALDYGLPRTVQVQELKFLGSPLFEKLGVKGGGVLSIKKEKREDGVVRLLPGTQFSIAAAVLPIEAEVYVGEKGVAITNEIKESVFDLSLKFKPELGAGQISVQLGLRLVALSECPIRDLDVLGPVVEWVDQVEARKSLTMELAFSHGRTAMTMPNDSWGLIEAFVGQLQLLSKLHLVARTLNSELKLPLGFQFKEEEVRDVELAFDLLRGERVAIGVSEIEFEPNGLVDVGDERNFRCVTTVAIDIFGQNLGRIPVHIDLIGFVVGASIPGKMKLLNGSSSKSWISYGEQRSDQGQLEVIRL